MITIGIDPHKASLTAMAIDAIGAEVASRRFPVNERRLANVIYRQIINDQRTQPTTTT